MAEPGPPIDSAPEAASPPGPARSADEVALELHQLDVLAVELPDDLRAPLVGERGKLLG